MTNEEFETLANNLISVNEAAELWGISRPRVKQLALEKKIVCAKIGSTYIILKNQQNPARKKA